MAEKRLVYRIGADNSELRRKFEEVKALAGNTGSSIGAIGKVPVSTANLRGILTEMRQMQVMAMALRTRLLNAVPDSQAARAYAGGLQMVEERMRHLQTLSNEVHASMTRLGNKITSIGAGMTVAVSVPLSLGANAMKNAGLRMDSLTRGLESVSDSAAEAKTRLAELEKIAELPGMGVPEVIASYIQLDAAGISAERAKKAIMEFGNALASAGRSKAELQAVVYNLTQIASMGKITGDEIRETAAYVPQLRQAMKDAFGTANTEELKELGVTATEFIDGVTKELAKLPRVTGGIANDFENMGDAVNRALAAGFRSVEPEVSAVVRSIDRLADSFADWSPAAQKMVVGLGAIVWAGGPVLTFAGQFANLMTAARMKLVAKTSQMMHDTMQQRLNTTEIARNTGSLAANTAAVNANAAAIIRRNTALAMTPVAAATAGATAAAGTAAVTGAIAVGTGAAAGAGAGLGKGAIAALAARGLASGGLHGVAAVGAAADLYMLYKILYGFPNERKRYQERDKRATERMNAYIADSKARQEMGQYGEIREKELGEERAKAVYRNVKDEEAAAKRLAAVRLAEQEAFVRRARETGQWAKVLQGELKKLEIAKEEALRSAQGPKERDAIITEFAQKARDTEEQLLREMATWRKRWNAEELRAHAEASAERLKLQGREADAERILAYARAQAEITALQERAQAGEDIRGRVLAVNASLQSELTEIERRESEKRREIAESEAQAKEALAVNWLRLQGRYYDAAYAEIINGYNQQLRALDDLAKKQAVPAAEYYKAWTDAALKVKDLNDQVRQAQIARREEARAAVEGIIAEQKQADEEAKRVQSDRVSFLQDMIVKRTEMIGGAVAAQIQRIEFERQERAKQAQQLFKDSRELNDVLLAIDEDAENRRLEVLRESYEKRERLMAEQAEKMRDQIRWTNPRKLWEDAMLAGARLSVSMPAMQTTDQFRFKDAGRVSDPMLEVLHKDLLRHHDRLEAIERRIGGL